jgi:spore coat protein CotF
MRTVSLIVDSLTNNTKHTEGDLLTTVFNQLGNRIQAEPELQQTMGHLSRPAQQERLFAIQIPDQYKEAFAAQLSARIQVPIVVNDDDDMVYSVRQCFLKTQLKEELHRAITASNPYGMNVLKRHCKGVTMMAQEFNELFGHLITYQYNGRQVRNVPRSMTKILTREEFILNFGNNTTWKVIGRGRYTAYLKFPLILSYNQKYCTAQFHFLVSVFSNADGRQVARNYMVRARPRRVQREAPRTIVLPHTTSNVQVVEID